MTQFVNVIKYVLKYGGLKARARVCVCVCDTKNYIISGDVMTKFVQNFVFHSFSETLYL